MARPLEFDRRGGRRALAAALAAAAAAACGAALMLLCGCARQDPGTLPLRLAAAASLRELGADVEHRFAAPRGIALERVHAGSSILARQIAAGARCDVFLSADLESIAAAGMDTAAARAVLGNRLAFVVRVGAPAWLAEPADLVGRDGLAPSLALAGAGVPAGRYARELLSELGLTASLAGRIVDGDDVRAALGMVESGIVDAALVYATDAALVRRAELRWTAPAGRGPEVRLYAARVGHGAEAGELFAWLQGPEFARLAAERGFEALRHAAAAATSPGEPVSERP